jgi:hypothetical protein
MTPGFIRPTKAQLSSARRLKENAQLRRIRSSSAQRNFCLAKLRKKFAYLKLGGPLATLSSVYQNGKKNSAY